MSVVIGILDTSDLTDIIIFVDFAKKKLTWIPLDLYIYPLRKRINKAYKIGGHKLLINTVRGLGFKAKYSICVPCQSSANVFQDLQLKVPVPESAEYYYPLKLFSEIELGKKIIKFNAPFELLSGERIHQFIGARFRKDKVEAMPDLNRIERQQIFAKSLLERNFDFKKFLHQEIFISHPDALLRLNEVNAQYSCELSGEFFPTKIQKKYVLLKKNFFTKIFKIYLNRVDSKFILIKQFFS